MLKSCGGRAEKNLRFQSQRIFEKGQRLSRRRRRGPDCVNTFMVLYALKKRKPIAKDSSQKQAGANTPKLRRKPFLLYRDSGRKCVNKACMCRTTKTLTFWHVLTGFTLLSLELHDKRQPTLNPAVTQVKTCLIKHKHFWYSFSF